MNGEVELSWTIDPDAQHVEFRAHQCAECGEHGPTTLAATPDWWVWGNKHTDETGHRKFYQWKMGRSAGQMETMPAPRRRRALGNRGT